MVLQKRYGLYAIGWAVLWLLATVTTSWATTAPTSWTSTLPVSQTSVNDILRQNGVQLRGSLCTPNPGCGNDTVQLIDTARLADNAKTRWTIESNSAVTGAIASVSFTSPGPKIITVTRIYSISATPNQPASTSVVSTTFTVPVGVRPPQFQKWRPDTNICRGEKITLDPYPGGAPPGVTYLWFPKGDETKQIQVDSSGCYSVEVFYADGCSTQDRIRVDVCGEKKAQQGVKWFFGANAGLDFQGGSPKPITDGKLNTIEGTSSIADTKGKLLFYTDGITVFDRNGNPMKLFVPGSSTLTSSTATSGTAVGQLGGNKRSTQSALIVPKPICNGCDYEYYVYTTSEVRGTRQLTYSIVDMRRNKGNGAVTQENIPVTPTSSTLGSTERSASVRKDKDTTYWVITHDYGKNCFRINHLTKSPTASEEVTCIGAAHDTPVRGEGQMKFGPAPVSTTVTATTGASGTPTAGTATAGASNTAVRPLAVVVPGDTTTGKKSNNKVELFDFNVETGKLTGPTRTIDLGPAPPKAYGVEFSPDGKSVYVTMLADTNANGSLKGPSYVLKYDISQKTDELIKESRTVVDSSTVRQYGSLQGGPDGKIYVAVKDKPTLGVIENPNGGLLDSLRFLPEGLNLGGKISQLGLPNQVANFNEPSNNPGLAMSDTCAGKPTTFQVTPNCQKLKEQYTLTFGDGSAPKSFTQASPQQHTYTNPGSYTATLRIVTLRASGAVCIDTTISTPFQILPVPDKISLGPDVEKCTNRGVPLEINVKAAQYLWLFNGRVAGRSKTILATRTGTYIGFAANGECFVSDTIKVLIRFPGILDLGPNLPICEKGTRVLTVPQKGFTEFQWSTGGNTRDITVSKPGAYSVVGTYQIGNITCEAIDSIRVNEVKNPKITAALTNPAGCTTIDGAIVVTPAAFTMTPATSFTYSWTTVSGTPVSTTGNSASALAQGNYKIRVIDDNACFVDSTFALKSKAVPLVLTARPGQQQCDVPGSGSATLGITGGTPVLYEWRDRNGAVVSTNPSLTGVSAGVYSVSVADNIGCIASLSDVQIGLNTSTTLSLGPDRSKCNGDTIQLSPRDGAASSISYRWSNGATTRTISVNTAGTYSLTTTNTLNSCVGSASVRAQFVAKPTVSAGANLSLCLGAPNSLTSLQLAGNSPGGGTWTGQNIDPTGRFTPPASLIGQTVTLTYSVTVNGCANSAPKQVALKQTPTVNAGLDAEFCEGIVQVLQATGSPGATFRWNDGTQGSQLRPQQSGNYTVTANVDGCEQTDAVLVNVKPAPRFAFTRDATICVGDNGRTILQAVPQSPGQTVVWTTSPATIASSLTVSQVGTYSVVVTGTNGCVARDAAKVVDLCEPRVFVPNAFSPNGDKNNDRFSTLGAYTTDLELRIYNRWGEVIFASTPETPDWDGTYRGEPAQTMVYPYVITYRSQYFPERPTAVKRGSVLLLR